MAKAKVTLNTLYEILQSHTAQLNVITTRLVSVEQKQDEHTLILRSLQERTEALSGLVDKLQLSFERLYQEYAMITAALRRLEQRFDRLEAERLNERITALE